MAFVYAVINDLFFSDRVSGALHQLGYQGQVVDLSSDPLPPFPANADLVLVDLEAGDAAVRVIKDAKAAGRPVLAFGPHTDLALREAALAAGATQVVAKSKFTSSFADLIKGLLA